MDKTCYCKYTTSGYCCYAFQSPSLFPIQSQRTLSCHVNYSVDSYDKVIIVWMMNSVKNDFSRYMFYMCTCTKVRLC